MANYCYTTYTITGNRKEIKSLYNLLKGLEKQNKFWLGDIINALGEDSQDFYCRGDWSDLEFTKDKLYFITESAWEPMNDVWDFVIKIFPSLKYYFYAEEPGTGYYSTNDVDGLYYCPYKYVLYRYYTPTGGYEQTLWDQFETIEEVIEWIESDTNYTIKTNEDVYAFIKRINEEEQDLYLQLDECKII